MALRQIAAIRIAKLEDRKTVASILHENGYTVGPSKRKRLNGKSTEYFMKVYEDTDPDAAGPTE